MYRRKIMLNYKLKNRNDKVLKLPKNSMTIILKNGRNCVMVSLQDTKNSELCFEAIEEFRYGFLFTTL